MDVINYLWDKFSFSKLSTFSKCPRRAFYRYVMKKKEPPSVALLFGRAAHNGQEADNYAKLKGQVLPIKEILDVAVSTFEEDAADASVHVDIDAFGDVHGRQLLVFEESGERARIRPIVGTIEAPFEIGVEIGSGDGPKTRAVLEGFTDVVSDYGGGREAIDYKTAARPVSTREASVSMQLGLEAIGAEAKQARIVSFVKPGKQKATAKVTGAVPSTTHMYERVFAYLADTIASFRACLKSGDFPRCPPDSYYCSREGCEFHQLCYPEKYEGLERWIEVKSIKPAGTLPPAQWRESSVGRKERMDAEAKAAGASGSAAAAAGEAQQGSGA